MIANGVVGLAICCKQLGNIPRQTGRVGCHLGLRKLQFVDVQSPGQGLQAAGNLHGGRGQAHGLFGVGKFDVAYRKLKIGRQLALFVVLGDKGKLDLSRSLSLAEGQGQCLRQIGEIEGQVEIFDITGQIGRFLLRGGVA